MDVIISFFRDFLSGPLYIVVVIISVIGIVACIGYLAEATLKQKQLEKRQQEMYAEVHFLPTDEASATSIVSNAATTLSSAQLGQIGNVATTNLAQSKAAVSSNMTSSTIGTSTNSNIPSSNLIQDGVSSDQRYKQ